MVAASASRHLTMTIAVALIVVSCGSAASSDVAASEPEAVASPTSAPASGDGCADVIDGAVRRTPDGTYSIDATVRSGDTGWEKYADRWDVLDSTGVILATRELAHPHENEQPFTRSLSNVVIPDAVDVVTIRARDSVAGYCGQTHDLAVNRE